MAGAISLGASKTTEDSTKKTTGTKKLDTQVDRSQTEKGSRRISSAKTGTQASDTTAQSAQKGQRQTLSDVTSLVEALDAESRESLSGLLQSLVDPEQASELSSLLGTRAASAEDEIAAANQAIVQEATARGEEQLGQAKQTLATGAGSSLNTLVQQFGLQESGRIQTDIAALASQLGLQGRQAVTSEIGAALQAQVSGATNVADVLKGALQTSEQQQAGSEVSASESTQLTQVLAELAETTSQEELSEILSTIGERKRGTESIDETSSGSSKARSKGVGLGFSF